LRFMLNSFDDNSNNTCVECFHDNIGMTNVQIKKPYVNLENKRIALIMSR
jgi:hypothetical protein